MGGENLIGFKPFIWRSNDEKVDCQWSTMSIPCFYFFSVTRGIFEIKINKTLKRKLPIIYADIRDLFFSFKRTITTLGVCQYKRTDYKKEVRNYPNREFI